MKHETRDEISARYEEAEIKVPFYAEVKHCPQNPAVSVMFFRSSAIIGG